MKSDEIELDNREERKLFVTSESVNNVTVQPTSRMDVGDGWNTGGRPAAACDIELRTYMKCKCSCCPKVVPQILLQNGCDRCLCCFTQCFRCTDSMLIDPNLDEDERFLQIEEWLRGFSVWPLPLLTLTTVIVEIAVFLHFRMQRVSFTQMLLESPMLFTQHKKMEIWRWFTYSFCHASGIHLLGNVISKLLLGLFLEIEHKVII